MSFLYPAFLIGGLAIAIPIVLHLLRRDIAPEVPFSAVRLLRRTPVEQSKRRRLRDALLLAARVLALLLLATAFARPYVPGAAGASLRVVAIDRSFSMTAPQRFARAIALARAAIDETGMGERVALIAFDDRASVLSEPGGAHDARLALERLEAGFGGTRYASAIAKAIELADGAPTRLVVVTDLERSGWEDAQPVTVPANWQIDVRDAGSDAGNLALAAVRREADRVIATVRNTGSEVRRSTIRAEVEGKSIASASFSADPGAVVDVPIPARLPATGGLAVSIEDPTGFAADNTRYAVLDAAARSGVLIVTSSGPQRQSGFFLAQALASTAGEDGGVESTVVAGTVLSTMPIEKLESFAAVALLSTRGLERRARETLGAYVRGGGGLFVAAAPEVEGELLSTAFEWKPALAPVESADRPLALAVTDLRHPIFRPFGVLAANLGQVRFERVWRVRPDGWDVAARFSDGTPGLLERTVGAGRVVLFASDLDRRWNDFPMHASFVPFALESVAYVSQARQTRDYTVADAPPEAGARPGLHRLAPTRVVAVNVDVRESATERLSAAEFQQMIGRDQGAPAAAPAANVRAQQIESRQSYWQYGLLLMLGVLAAESVVGRR